MKKCFFGLLVAAATLAAPWMGSVIAATIPLSDLLVEERRSNQVTRSSPNFTYRKTGDMPAAENVNVEAIEQDGDFGLMLSGRIRRPSRAATPRTRSSRSTSACKNAGMLINGVTLTANPAVFDGAGLASVTETFLPVVTDDKLVVYDFGDGDDLLLDSITFANGYTTLPVQKDLILHATGDTGAVTMSFFTQTFSQVPEPSSFVLAAAGLLCLGRIRRRHP